MRALIEIDNDTVSDWARSNDVPYTGFTSLTENMSVVDLIRSEIDWSDSNTAPARIVTPVNRTSIMWCADPLRAAR